MKPALTPTRLLLAALALLVPSCSTTPEDETPLVAPAAFVASTDHFAGTLLAGESGGSRGAAGAASVDRTDGGAPPPAGLALRARLLLVARMERVEAVARGSKLPVAPIVDELSFVANLRASDPLGATSRLAAGGGVLRGEPARDLYDQLAAGGPSGAFELFDLASVVLPDVTTLVRAAAESGRFIAALHGRDATRADLTLELAPVNDPGEIVKLAQPLVADEGPLLLILPSPNVGGADCACLLRLELALPPGEEPARAHHAAAVEEAIARLRRATAGAEAPPAEPKRESGLAADAVRHLTRDARCRPTLVALSMSCDAKLLSDLALVAADDELAELLERLEQAQEKLLALVDEPAALLFALEREAWSFLSSRAFSTGLSAELDALLYRHAGAVAAWPATLDDLVGRCGDAAGLKQALLDENRRLLESRDAAVRVRAFDWLAERGLTPPGFDPLAPIEQRRAALEPQEGAKGP